MAQTILVIDDSVTKPFSPRELTARVRAVPGRSDRASSSSAVLRAADSELDRDRRMVRAAGRSRLDGRRARRRPLPLCP